MASEIVDVLSINNFASSYVISTTDFSDILIDSSDEKILESSPYNEYLSANNNCRISMQSSNDNIQDFLEEFIQISPECTEHLKSTYNKPVVGMLPINNENQVATTDLEKGESSQFMNISETPIASNLVDISNIDIVKESALLELIATPLTSRQLRYRKSAPQVCEICDKIFKARHHLLRHRLEKHMDQSPDQFAHPCKQCDKRFKRREHLLQHQRIRHSNVREHVCEKCGKRFFRKAHLQRHMLHHERKKSYSMCMGCGRTFARPGNLIRHVTNGCIDIRAPGQR